VTKAFVDSLAGFVITWAAMDLLGFKLNLLFWVALSLNFGAVLLYNWEEVKEGLVVAGSSSSSSTTATTSSASATSLSLSSAEKMKVAEPNVGKMDLMKPTKAGVAVENSSSNSNTVGQVAEVDKPVSSDADKPPASSGEDSLITPTTARSAPGSTSGSSSSAERSSTEQSVSNMAQRGMEQEQRGRK
jgi:hypothetical protein